MNGTAALTTLSNDWRSQDALDAIKKHHQDNLRGIGMSGWMGNPITPQAFIDGIEAMRETLDAGAPHRPDLAEHIKVWLEGIEYDKTAWEEQGKLIPLNYPDGLTTAPHMYSLLGVCDRVREDSGNKKRKPRQRRRSQAVATITKG